MRKLAFITILLIIVLGCSISVFGDKIRLIKPINSPSLYFSDEDIVIQFSFPTSPAINVLGKELDDWLFKGEEFKQFDFKMHKTINFVLRNKSSQSMIVNWNQSSITLPSGEVSQVIHEGVRFINAGRPMSSTTIPPHGTLSEAVAPVSRISSDAELYPLGLKEGSTFGLYLSLEINGRRKTYDFKFRADQIVIEGSEKGAEEQKKQVTRADDKGTKKAEMLPGIHVIGLSLPTVGTIQRNRSQQIIGLGGLNFLLGVSYRRYIGHLHPGINFFWGGGTFILIVPYWEFGMTYSIPLGYQEYFNIDLDFIYIYPILGLSYAF